MAVSLAKGQKVDLTKTNPGLTKIRVGLGWDTNKYDGQADFDLDAEVFLLAGNEKVRSDADFIFYNQPTSVDGAVVHQGDNRTGEGDGDDESINIQLGGVDSAIEKIRFTVTIDDAETRNQNFGQVSNAFIRIVNADSEEELIRYDLGEDFSIETAIVVGELYRHNGEWKFTAIGSGYQGGLAALGKDFGVNIG
ncbi:TerD family protein [Carnobacterium gallinarum]|uniref:TerD family protein n=1 Tax=Carnobacterium gallinarum TaxID=2749 RepID=UPI000553C060